MLQPPHEAFQLLTFEKKIQWSLTDLLVDIIRDSCPRELRKTMEMAAGPEDLERPWRSWQSSDQVDIRRDTQAQAEAQQDTTWHPKAQNSHKTFTLSFPLQYFLGENSYSIVHSYLNRLRNTFLGITVEKTVLCVSCYDQTTSWHLVYTHATQTQNTHTIIEPSHSLVHSYFGENSYSIVHSRFNWPHITPPTWKTNTV